MIPRGATLDVSRELVQHLARLLWAERRLRGTPGGSRALTPFWHAVLILRRSRGETDIPKLDRDHKISRATAYRHIEEGIETLADQALEWTRSALAGTGFDQSLVISTWTWARNACGHLTHSRVEVYQYIR